MQNAYTLSDNGIATFIATSAVLTERLTFTGRDTTMDYAIIIRRARCYAYRSVCLIRRPMFAAKAAQ